MGNFDIKSMVIGILSTALFFILIGAEDKSKFGDIIVNSITIQDDGHGGFITAYNKDQKKNIIFGDRS